MNSCNSTNFYSPEDLRNILRLLWSHYVMWTRFALISRTSGTDDTKVVDNRLYEFPINLADVFSIYYGKETATLLQTLFQENINILLSLMDSILEENPKEIKKLEQQWQDNSAKIGHLLHSINTFYDEKAFRSLMNNLLYMTEDEIIKRKNKQYAQDVYHYDFIEYHSLMIADILWRGFIKKFY